MREDHTDPADVKNAIVALTAKEDDAGRVLFGGSDFVAYPRLSRDGRLAWMAWDHPNMPWDDTRLYVAELGPDGLSHVEVVAGCGAESVMEPKWGPDGALYFISDRSGFWNLYVRRDGETKALLPMEAEFAGPLWGLGQSNYVLMEDDRIVATYGDAEGDHLVVIEPGMMREIALPFTVIGALHALDERTVAMAAASGVQTGGGDHCGYRNQGPPVSSVAPHRPRSNLAISPKPRLSPSPAPAGWRCTRSTIRPPMANLPRPTTKNAAADRAGAWRSHGRGKASSSPQPGQPVLDQPRLRHRGRGLAVAPPATAAPIASG